MRDAHPEQSRGERLFLAQAAHRLEQRGENDPKTKAEADEPHPVKFAEHQSLDCNRQRDRDAEQPPDGFGRDRELAAAPGRMHADGQEHHQRQHRHQEHHGKYRWSDGDLADPQQLVDQGRQSAPQHQCGDAHQDHIVHQYKELAREQFKSPGCIQLWRPPRIQGQRTADGQHQEGQNVKPTSRIGRERMHRHQHARAHQEGPHQAQGEREYREQQASNS